MCKGNQWAVDVVNPHYQIRPKRTLGIAHLAYTAGTMVLLRGDGKQHKSRNEKGKIYKSFLVTSKDRIGYKRRKQIIGKSCTIPFIRVLSLVVLMWAGIGLATIGLLFPDFD